MTCPRTVAVVLALACVVACLGAAGCAAAPPVKPKQPPAPKEWKPPAGWLRSSVTTEGLRITFAAPSPAHVGQDWPPVVAITNTTAETTTLPNGVGMSVYVLEGVGHLTVGDARALQGYRRKPVTLGPGATTVLTRRFPGNITRGWKPAGRRTGAIVSIARSAPTSSTTLENPGPPGIGVRLPELKVKWLGAGAS